MNLKKYFFYITLLNNSFLINVFCINDTHTSFVPMTCGQNLYTQYHKLLFPSEHKEYYAGMMLACDACNNSDVAVDFSTTYRYIQSRNSKQIATYLWGSNEFIFQGNEVANRNENALIAEYFGMGPDTNMTAVINPQLKNQVLDFQLVVSLEKAWFQINVPLMWARWRPQSGCSEFLYNGYAGKNNLDEGNVFLQYGWKGGLVSADGVATMNVNGADLTNISIGGVAGCIWFDNRSIAGADNSVIGQLNADGALTEASLQNTSIQSVSGLKTRATVLADGGAVSIVEKYNQTVPVGIIPLGLYGKVTTSAPTVKSAVLYLDATVDPVLPVSAISIGKALGQEYSFGKFAGRMNNNFNFSSCTKFNVADLPMMFGYDFCKSDAYHIGLYVKCVLPTGTKIDESFLNYVLTPVIGNGHHFELGIGASAHMNFFVCDESAYGIFCDGYIDKMFGAWQTRVFDLPGQPMSRYALAFPVSGNTVSGYSVDGNTMVSIGDVNIYQGKVSAVRGEFILNGIYSLCNMEFGVGYAFAGQTAESICSDCDDNKNMLQKYGIVGQASQHLIGVGSVFPANANIDTGYFNHNYSYQAGTINAPAVCTVLVNFFDLGASNQVAVIADSKSAAYSYGQVEDATNSSLVSMYEYSNNCSGLMNGQILHRIFGHFDYVWRNVAYQPELGIVGSIGFSPCQKVTAAYWDIGARAGFVF